MRVSRCFGPGLPANAGRRARSTGSSPVLGGPNALPFADDAFDALTFTYLFRYVDDPAATMRELARVVRPGGSISSLEFHVPQQPLLRVGWYAYTRGALPDRRARWRVRRGGGPGRFLGPSIDRFERRAPLARAGAVVAGGRDPHVRSRVLSLGAGVVIWGVKGDAGER